LRAAVFERVLCAKFTTTTCHCYPGYFVLRTST
jgi:hypothetical protein